MDKRTKEYKEWKKRQEEASSGLGDTIDKVTEKTGIKKAVKQIFGEDCGCDERRKKLNKLFSYKPKGCFSEQQYNQWTDFRNVETRKQVSVQEQRLISAILRDVYKIAVKPTCQGCTATNYKKWIDMINKFYETYQ